MILFLTLKVTECIFTATSTRQTPTGKRRSSMLIANVMEVWGVSSDMGDADSIPWSKPRSKKFEPAYAVP